MHEEEAVMAHAEADQDVELDSSSIEQFGLSNWVADGLVATGIDLLVV
jgi:hypothetical protein